ncbi:nephrocystin-3-like isoform X2 [Halichondria panicea]|uniref:nephrocystin-3-like isoform X2 n=1 Tax=Halichondria panicea TaxID=6063 RepID=UPI00312B8CEA
MTDLSELDTLRLENSRLQLKVRAQDGVFQKLLKEKVQAQKELLQAEEDMRLMRHEFELREKMFLNTRDENEMEIATLKSINQSLEARLNAALDSDDGGVEILDSRDAKVLAMSTVSPFYSLPKLSAVEAVETLSKWEGMGSTINLLQAIINEDEDVLTWKAGSPWTSNWKYVLTLYISAPLDTHQELNLFWEEFMPQLDAMAHSCGSYLNAVVLTTSDVQRTLTDEQTLSYAADLVGKTDIFVALLKDDATELTKVEIETGFLNCPSTRPCLFLLLPGGSNQDSPSKSCRLKERIKKMKSYDNARINECKESRQEHLVWLYSELNQTLKQFDVFETKTQLDVMEMIAYQQDKRREWEQVQILESLLEDAPLSLVGLEQVFSQLDEYIAETGPVATLLLSGPGGNGKSTILAKWMDRRAENEGIIMFYHFVSGEGFSNAEVAVVYRRFLQKLMYFCNDEGEVSYCPADLEREFCILLEKASTLLECPDDRLLLIIDGADVIMENNKYMNWISKPLPSNVRVILSARDDKHPESWRNLPSPTVPTATSTDIIEIINGVQEKIPNCNKLNEEQISMLAVCAPEVPRWCVVAVRNLLRFSNLEGDELDEYIEELDEYQDVPDLLACFIHKLSCQYPNVSGVVGQILKLLFSSRNGLLLAEIVAITRCSLGLVSTIIVELKSRMLVTGDGLISLSNEQVQEAVLLQYNVIDYLSDWTPPLLDYFSSSTSKNATQQVRIVEELPWMLKRGEMLEELANLILNVDILILACASGQSGELLGYWSYLNADPASLVQQYHKLLLVTEETKIVTSELLALFRITGKLLSRLGFAQQALLPLQHALELSESQIDSNSTDIAQSLYELAIVHSNAGHLETAEDLYVQTIESFDDCNATDSRFCLKVLRELSSLYKENGKNDMSDDILTRMMSMKESNQSSVETSEILLKRVEYLEEVCSTGDDSTVLIRCLNQLGVVLAVYGDTDNAEEKFLKCLKHYDSVAPAHDGIVVILRNLGRFYTEKERYDLAVPLMENAYEIVVKTNTFKDSDVMCVTESLALLHREERNFERAEFLQRELLDLKLKHSGEHSLEVAKVMNNLAVLCCLRVASFTRPQKGGLLAHAHNYWIISP